MKSILIALVACIVCGIAGGAIGWHLKGQAVAAADERQAKADAAGLARDFGEQIKTNTDTLEKQQAESAALLAQQNLIRGAGVDLRLEIDHAQFTPTEWIGLARTPACPDPAASAEFERLYDAAAQGKGTDNSAPAGAR